MRTSTRTTKTLATLGGLLALAGLAACNEASAAQPTRVDVKAVDYGFQGIPDHLKAGEVRFSFENTSGSEQHEMQLVRLKDPNAKLDDLLKLPPEQAMQQVDMLGLSMAPPKSKSGLDTVGRLTPGRYAVFCMIPVQGKPDGAPHAMVGMTKEFTVG